MEQAWTALKQAKSVLDTKVGSLIRKTRQSTGIQQEQATIQTPARGTRSRTNNTPVYYRVNGPDCSVCHEGQLVVAEFQVGSATGLLPVPCENGGERQQQALGQAEGPTCGQGPALWQMCTVSCARLWSV